MSALYNFYAALEVDEASLHKACTKYVGFFAVWALETEVPKMFQAVLVSLYGFVAFSNWHFGTCTSQNVHPDMVTFSYKLHNLNF